MLFSGLNNFAHEQTILEHLEMLLRFVITLLTCTIVYMSTTGVALSQPTAKELYDACRKALNTGGIYRAYIDGSGRLICYHADIETGAVYNHQNGGGNNFSSQTRRTAKKSKSASKPNRGEPIHEPR